MPIKDKDTLVHEYPLATRGINYHTNIVQLHPEEALLTQNCTWKNGIVKRGGSSKFETDEVAASKKILGLHRFYYSTASKQLLATAGTVMRRHDGATWQNIRTGLTDGAQMHFATWGGVQKVYYSNGTDGSLYSWDGSSDVALTGGNLPALVVVTLPYQDRLLAIDNTNPGTLTWSASYDDTPANWETNADCGVRPDSQLFGMVYHSINNSDAGYESAVLLAGANGMYLFKGSDLRTPSTLGNYTIYPLATCIGCNAPRTMIWTPKGTIYLGIDRQVYLLPFESSTPIPIGDKIRSNISGVEGIEKIPAAQISDACAVYHEGYYKLSITQSGQTINKIQFWLDVTRLNADEKGMIGPWYGPMTGQSISVFASQDGNGDVGELMAGEDDPTTGSFVYQVSRTGVYNDSNTSFNVRYQTFYNPLGTNSLNKDIHEIEFELIDIEGAIGIEFHDITGSIKVGDTIPLSGSAYYWDDMYYDEQYYSASAPTRQRVPISPAINARRLSIIIEYNFASDTMEIYSIKVKATENNDVFAGSNVTVSPTTLSGIGLEAI